MMTIGLSKKSIHHGLRLFLILTLAGYSAIFYLTGSRETFAALKFFQFRFFLIALLLIGVDLFSGAGRIWIFIRKISRLPDRSAFWIAFKSNLANIFLAAATPFQTGGGLAQIYMLNRHGISVAGATSVSMMNFMATLLFLLISGIMVIRWMARRYTDFQFHFILTFSSSIFYAAFAVFLVFLLRPMAIGRAVEWILLRLKFWSKREHYARKIESFILSYQAHIRKFWKKDKKLLFHNLWLTAVLYFNKCLLAYVILLGMNQNPDFTEVVSVQILIIFLIYFCPTPGASFLAETSCATLMSLFIARHLVSVFSILWRFFTTYFGVILGGVVLMRTIGTETAEASPEPASSPVLQEKKASRLVRNSL